MKNIIEKGSLGLIDKSSLDNIKSIEDLANSVITYEEKKKYLNQVFDIIIGNNNRLLLIIDELDRCKPDFAVKFLETIKHFYNNDKITIIISTDNKQLSCCIRNYYGNDFDGYGYLNKIYDTVISIDMIKRKEYIRKYCEFNETISTSSQIVFFLIDYYNLSLRQCNRLISMYDLCYKYIIEEDDFDREKWELHSIFLIIGIVLKIVDIDEYDEYIAGKDDNYVNEIMHELFIKESKHICFFNKKLDSNYEDTLKRVLDIYHEIFENSNKSRLYPIHEALTFIGNEIQIDGE